MSDSKQAAPASSPYGNFQIFSYVIPKPIAITYVLSILYNVTFFMQFITAPLLIKSMGVSDTDNGYIQTYFGFVQMLGGPVFGYITQKFGIRISLFVCYGSTMLSSILLYTATDVTTLIISRIPCMLSHGQQGHQTLLSALTQPGKERTNAFGRMGLTFGAGFILSPMFSVISTKLLGSEKAPVLISAILCILPFLVLEFWMDRKSYEESHNDTSSSTVLTLRTAIQIVNRPGILNVMFKKNAPIAPMFLIFSIMQIYMVEKFATTTETTHLIQMLIGACIMVSNGFGVIWLRKKFEENKLLFIGACSFSMAFFLFFFFTNIYMLLIIMPFVSMGMSLTATVADSMLTALVEEKEQGLILGLANSINSLSRTVAPAIGGYLLDHYGFSCFSIIGFIFTLFAHLSLVLLPVDPALLKKAKHE